MTAVEKSIQDQLNRVASKAEGTTTETEDENLEEDTVTEPTETDESTDPEAGSNPEGDDDSTKEEERKQAGAFAAMRKRLKELEEENKTLKQQTTTKKPVEESDDDPEDSKQPTALEKRLEEAEKYIRQLQEEQTKKQSDEQQKRIAQEVIDVKQKYNLDEAGLMEFADVLEERGFQIGNTSMTLSDMYAAINHDKLVSAEVEKAKQEILAGQSGDVPPSTGPKPAPGGGTKRKDNIRDTLARVAEKLS